MVPVALIAIRRARAVCSDGPGRVRADDGRSGPAVLNMVGLQKSIHLYGPRVPIIAKNH